jgi:hypothetical protein
VKSSPQWTLLLLLLLLVLLVAAVVELLLSRGHHCAWMGSCSSWLINSNSHIPASYKE